MNPVETKTINLARALKLKNSVIAQINRAKSVMARENCRKVGYSTSKVDLPALHVKIDGLIANLVEIKTAIAVANCGIYKKLAEMEELKSQITWFSGLNMREGKEYESAGYDNPEREVEYKAYINRDQCDETTELLQKRIEKLQDEVDAFNANTTITVPSIL